MNRILSRGTRPSGGINPPKESRKLEKGFWNAAVPSRCVVPLQQHVGSRLDLHVRTGDIVREGMIIADGEGRFSVPVHAPIPGRIASVGKARLFDGTDSVAVMIELSGEFDRLGKKPDRREWSTMTPEELRMMVRTGGVVGTGRSPVPMHLYLKPHAQDDNPVLVLDLAETEPYMSGDTELTYTYPAAVAEGLRIAGHILQTDACRVVYTTRTRRAVSVLRPSLQNDARLRRVRHSFPGNTEEHLRRVLFSAREYRQEQQRVVALRPGTAFAIYEAVVLGKPQIERVIAVGGGAVARPAHIRIRVGTSVADAFAECGGLVEEPARIVAGGPLTGDVVRNIEAPLSKNVPALLALTESEMRAAREYPCIGCGSCVRACPVGIDPIRIHDLVQTDRAEDAEKAGMHRCIDCGLCAYVCPARIPLRDRIQTGKRQGAQKSSPAREEESIVLSEAPDE